MAIEEMFTSLPTVSTVQMSDIICAVQGFVPSSNLGVSVQETIQQVYNLFQSNIILSNAGNPNGFVAGTTYQLCWDTVDLILWVCTTSGTALTAVWTEGNNVQGNWRDVVSTPINLVQDVNYVTNNGAALTQFTLPLIASFGTIIEISGKSSGGWAIAQNAGQTINFGNITTTSGIGGSLASTNQYDYVKIVCVTANTIWNIIGSIGIITII